MQIAPHIYVDADACPVKAEVARVAERHGLAVTYLDCSAADSTPGLPAYPASRSRYRPPA
jgi:uncharacterized protein YaiI (UPF0178 family)